MKKMKIGIKVGDIMTRDFVSVDPETSLKDCAEKMIKKRVGSLILEKDKNLEGIIVGRDIIWAMTKKSVENLEKIKAKDIAKKKVVTIKPQADVYEALQRMKKGKYRWLPVTVKGNLVGFLTLKDILRIEPSLFEIAHSEGAFPIKEESRKLERKERRKNKKGWETEGVCSECGNFDLLYEIDGKLLCESCKDQI